MLSLVGFSWAWFRWKLGTGCSVSGLLSLGLKLLLLGDCRSQFRQQSPDPQAAPEWGRYCLGPYYPCPPSWSIVSIIVYYAFQKWIYQQFEQQQMKKNSENIFFDILAHSRLEEREVRNQLYDKLLQVKQRNKERDQEIDALKKKSLQLQKTKEEYAQKIRQNEQILKKSGTHLFVLRENLKKIYLQYIYSSQDPVDIDNMTYEELLELQQQMGHVSKGLSQQQIKKLRREEYAPNASVQCRCSVCQEQFSVGNSVIILQCKHVFHEQCISEWLRKEKVCPLCKSESI